MHGWMLLVDSNFYLFYPSFINRFDGKSKVFIFDYFIFLRDFACNFEYNSSNCVCIAFYIIKKIIFKINNFEKVIKQCFSFKKIGGFIYLRIDNFIFI